MKLQKDLHAFVELLNSRRVDYVVVGGHAVAFHGHPRFTGDIDFLVRPEPANAARLIEVLEAFGFGGIGVSAADFLTPGRVVQLGRVPNRIDLLTGITGVTIDEIWAGRVAGVLDDLPVQFIGKDALLKNKSATGRTKDLADAEALRRRS